MSSKCTTCGIVFATGSLHVNHGDERYCLPCEISRQAAQIAALQEQQRRDTETIRHLRQSVSDGLAAGDVLKEQIEALLTANGELRSEREERNAELGETHAQIEALRAPEAASAFDTLPDDYEAPHR